MCAILRISHSTKFSLSLSLLGEAYPLVKCCTCVLVVDNPGGHSLPLLHYISFIFNIFWTRILCVVLFYVYHTFKGHFEMSCYFVQSPYILTSIYLRYDWKQTLLNQFQASGITRIWLQNYRVRFRLFFGRKVRLKAPLLLDYRLTLKIAFLTTITITLVDTLTDGK